MFLIITLLYIISITFYLIKIYARVINEPSKIDIWWLFETLFIDIFLRFCFNELQWNPEARPCYMYILYYESDILSDKSYPFLLSIFYKFRQNSANIRLTWICEIKSIKDRLYNFYTIRTTILKQNLHICNSIYSLRNHKWIRYLKCSKECRITVIYFWIVCTKRN